METIDIFLPPKGNLFLAREDGFAAGCVGTRSIGDAIAELKRIYVRRQGIVRFLHRGKKPAKEAACG
jgi:hypothetical protein